MRPVFIALSALLNIELEGMQMITEQAYLARKRMLETKPDFSGTSITHRSVKRSRTGMIQNRNQEGSAPGRWPMAVDDEDDD